MSENKSFAIIALILSILLPFVGLILGIIALKKINKTPEKKGKVLAIIAIIIGSILTLLIMLFLMLPMIMYYNVLKPVHQPSSPSSVVNHETQPNVNQELDPVTIPKIDNPSTGRCLFAAGFRCIEFSVSKDKVRFILKNEIGTNITIKEVILQDLNIKDEDKNYSYSCKSDNTIELKHNNYALIEVKNCDFDEEFQVLLDVAIKYKSQYTRNDYLATLNGNIQARFY